jgi:hypothetical protein
MDGTIIVGHMATDEERGGVRLFMILIRGQFSCIEAARSFTWCVPEAIPRNSEGDRANPLWSLWG